MLASPTLISFRRRALIQLILPKLGGFLINLRELGFAKGSAESLPLFLGSAESAFEKIGPSGSLIGTSNRTYRHIILPSRQEVGFPVIGTGSRLPLPYRVP